MHPVTDALPPAVGQLQDCPAIAAYLNTAIALEPPLRVEGQPPLLHIHLPVAHLYRIGDLLPRFEQALKALSGPQYWDVYVFTPDENTGSRLIHHALIEQSPAPRLLLPPVPTSPAKPPIPMPSSAPAATPDPAASPAPALPLATPPTANIKKLTWQQRTHARQRRYHRRRLIAGAIAITCASFGLGTLASVGLEWGRSRVGQSLGSAPENAAPVLEPALSSPTATLVDPARDLEGTLKFPISLPPMPANSLVEPITSASSLNVGASALAMPMATPVAVQIKAVGDVIPGTDFPDYRLPRDPNYLFNSVKMFMGEVDLVFGNFESTLTAYPYTAKNVGQGMTFAFRTPPAWTDVLKSAGFDVLSVANNHSFDFGDPGFDDTIANIQQSGMHAVGRKGEIVKVKANGYTIAFMGFSYWPDHNDMNDLPAAQALVQQAQAEADMVVISVHAGAEGTDALRVRNQTEYFFSENRGNMVQFSRAMVDAGADLILGHGPHVPRAVELYQDKLIAYSLGNFLGYRTLSTVGPLGLSMILQVELGEEGDFLRGRLIPVALDQNGVPYIDQGFASVTLVQQLTRQDFPETPLTIDDMGYILRTDQP